MHCFTNVTFIRLILASWTDHLAISIHVGRGVRVARVAQEQICPNRSEVRRVHSRRILSRRKRTSGRHCRHTKKHEHPSLLLRARSLPISRSFVLVLAPCATDVSSGAFFYPTWKNRSAVYLKRWGFIAHSRGNDTLSNNHLARIPWSRAIGSTVLPRATKFLANRQRSSEGTRAGMPSEKTGGRCFPAQTALFPAAVR